MREETLLTPEWVANKQTFLDWDTQPSSFKQYPHFCYRIPLRNIPSLQWLAQTRCMTDEHLVAQKPYIRLNVPSAGNLHPIEIYLQIRNVAGMLSGIYHFDVLNEELVLIKEIAGEGIEPHLGIKTRFSGVIVMISLVPFRSGWKYGLRSWRYLYLDLGHQIGALTSSVRHFGLTFTKMAPQKEVSRMMGMGDDEVIAAVYGVGETSSRPVKSLSEPLMRVQPTDYTLIAEKLYSAVQGAEFYTHIPQTQSQERFLELNRSRRSTREFNWDAMDDAIIIEIMQCTAPKSLEIVPIVLQAHTMHTGVYRNIHCEIRGNFVSEIVHLLLNQRFIAGANMVLLIFADDFSASAHVEAGIYAQDIYMLCENYNVGCSGVGAFYDNEASRWSNRSLLYAVAVGGKI